LECMLKGKVGTCGLDSSGSGWVPVESPCDLDNESSDSIKDGEFLYQLSMSYSQQGLCSV
jgi:hypothetical protein